MRVNGKWHKGLLKYVFTSKFNNGQFFEMTITNRLLKEPDTVAKLIATFVEVSHKLALENDNKIDLKDN